MSISSTLKKIILTFLISMVPVIELRGAVPWACKCGLPVWAALAVSVVGNLVPVPFIILFIRRIFNLMRKWKKLDNLVTKLENRAKKKSDVVQKYEFWGLFLLVAIPLPGTGAWTGALVAAMMDMRLKRAMPAIALGVLAAGVIMALASYGLIDLLF